MEPTHPTPLLSHDASFLGGSTAVEERREKGAPGGGGELEWELVEWELE
jgi:hypothetical protein